MFARPAALLLTLFALAPLTSASTWIVDDGGGPGVDFTTIGAAILVAAPGDVILVRPGTYAGFTLDKGISILGEVGADVTSQVLIVAIPAPRRATLAGLALRTLRITGCSAPITIEDTTIQPLEANLSGVSGMVTVAGCDDVRMRNVTVRYQPATWLVTPALRVTSSRVEITHSRLEGTDGISCGFQYPGNAQPGADGIVGVNGADLHVARSDVTGGRGGSTGAVECQSNDAADGKPAIRLMADATALISGTTEDVILGGAQGQGNSCSEDGEPGNGIVVAAGPLRVSGATILGESYYPGCGGMVAPIVGPFTQAVPADPTMSFSGSPRPNQLLVFLVTGAPGDFAQVTFGRQLSVLDLPNVEEDQLLVPLRTLGLGYLPASGVLGTSIIVPAGWSPGQIVVAQGRTTSPSGSVSLTHSLPITVR